jgi:hypothetical protein
MTSTQYQNATYTFYGQIQHETEKAVLLGFQHYDMVQGRYVEFEEWFPLSQIEIVTSNQGEPTSSGRPEYMIHIPYWLMDAKFGRRMDDLTPL